MRFKIQENITLYYMSVFFPGVIFSQTKFFLTLFRVYILLRNFSLRFNNAFNTSYIIS